MTNKQPQSYPGTVIKGIDIPFGNMVVLLIKLSLAVVAAGIILSPIYVVVMAVFAGVFRAFLF